MDYHEKSTNSKCERCSNFKAKPIIMIKRDACQVEKKDTSKTSAATVSRPFSFAMLG